MRASVGIRVVGTFDLIKKASFFAAVVSEEVAASFSVPPVAALSLDVRPRRR